MDGVTCPIECVGIGCPQPDFIERNGAWLLTVLGVLMGCFGGLLTYFLKSRCHKISCCGVVLDRQGVDLKPEDYTVSTTSKES